MKLNKLGRVLIVGVNSKIGGALYKDLQKYAISVLGTTRKKNVALGDPRIIYLDLKDEVIDEGLLPEVDIVYIMASVTSMAECVSDSDSYGINVSRISQIGSLYMKRGSFIIFASTNAVFSGEKFEQNECDIVDPITIYGSQKRDAENALLNSAALIPKGRLAIVRMTKVLTHDITLIKDWTASILDGRPIEAFIDLKISIILAFDSR
jgi:dTDP-4-dehydrorhamnose reductase